MDFQTKENAGNDHSFSAFQIGVPWRVRTVDLLVVTQMLSQLS